ncbi:SCO family protein [Microvirga sp. 2TAF3]|uniref:SCO family protein n=1 Tax=Microvirga sp. 2TAF3 TaxID=3233014 RepID=UPI003F9618B3
MKPFLAAFIALILTCPALAGLTERGLSEVAFAPGLEAQVPTSLVFRDLQSSTVTLGEALAGRAGLLIPVDYTCRTTCGPALSIVASALAQTNLNAGDDYRLIVVGIDPKDSSGDARTLVRTRIGDEALFSSTSVLLGDARTVKALLTALGYRTAYDVEHDQFAHPSGVVTLLPDGRISRVLSTLALDPLDLRLALVEAGQGHVGGLTDRITLLCYGFDAVHGIYTPMIRRILQLAGAGTLAGFGLALAALYRRSRRAGFSHEGKS